VLLFGRLAREELLQGKGFPKLSQGHNAHTAAVDAAVREAAEETGTTAQWTKRELGPVWARRRLAVRPRSL
jgi:8-oxo-dGTP pyrophosphatase MutT (NUDIX family)